MGRWCDQHQRERNDHDHYAYTVTLTLGDTTYQGPFYGSRHNYQEGTHDYHTAVASTADEIMSYWNDPDGYPEMFEDAKPFTAARFRQIVATMDRLALAAPIAEELWKHYPYGMEDVEAHLLAM